MNILFEKFHQKFYPLYLYLLNFESNHQKPKALRELTPDHIYGFPYIPGSAIKGVLRNYLINKYFKNSNGKAVEEIALKDKGFCDIFSCPKKNSYNKEERQ